MARAAAVLGLVANMAFGARVAPSGVTNGLSIDRRASASWKGCGLPPELVWGVLDHVPQPVQIAWSLGTRMVTTFPVVGEAPRQLRPQGFPLSVWEVHFFPGRLRLLVVTLSSDAYIEDVASGRELHRLRHTEEAREYLVAARVSPDGGLVATLGSEETLAIWSATTGELLRRIPVAQQGRGHRALEIFPGGRFLATGAPRYDSRGLIWDAVDGQAVGILPQPHGIANMFIAPCGKMLVTAGTRGIQFWRMVRGTLTSRHLPESSTHLAQVAVSWKDGAVAASTAGKILIWDGHSAHLRMKLHNAAAHSTYLVFSPTGARLIMLDRRGHGGAVVDARSGKRLFPLEPAPGVDIGEVELVVSSPVVEIVAACGSLQGPSRKWVTAWSSLTGKVLRSEVEEHNPDDTYAFCSLAIGGLVPMSEALRA
eukprot:CAMPEP_0176082820 /NCGR_PEP_ID=MMETSP0120_2-20121206/41430_1 /TAXON_ID=160619 /ORGANISM="Kryptoperidinium foliaceum, Strain CCMP 1326" /LENGTH=424 /DNA_ID=CAMNT_0017416593 /DNA_START=1 /DNA_END=1275 /DNA_ORIENTATION=+